MRRLIVERRPGLVLLFSLLLIASQVVAQTGGAYDLTWNTIDAGGGQSVVGVYALSGTIGQLDAGQIGAGVYTLGAGFWGGGVVTGVRDKLVYLPLAIK